MVLHSARARVAGRPVAAVVAALVVALGPVGCSAPSSGAAPAPAPSAAATTSAATPTRTPSAAPAPSRADDTAHAKRALVTAQQLGKPWIAAGKVNSSGVKGEACPGKPSTDRTVKPLSSAGTQFTAGRQTGAAIAVAAVWTYAGTADVERFGTALAASLRACRTYTDATKLHVVLTPEGAATLDGADRTWRYAERIYYDGGHTKLAYARHYVVAQHGRVLCSVQYAFLTPKGDPQGKDFSVVQKMAQRQLDRVRSEFPQT